MKLREIVFLGVVLTILHVAYSHNCIYFSRGRSSVFKDMTESVNKFSADLYKAVLNDPSTSEDFISSSLSVAMVLLMTSFGARGSTAAELNRFLHADKKINECTMRTLTTELNNYTNVELSLANKIFANSRGKIHEKYQNSVEFGFLQEVESVDFTQSTAAAKIINDWCERQTHSRIKDIIQPGSLSSSAALVLVNAIYFKGQWAKTFDKLDTTPLPFYRADGSQKIVPMMFIQEKYRYGKLPNVSARFLELPYKSKAPGDNVSMYIILPDERDGLHKIEKNIHDISLKKLQSGVMTKMSLLLPKFKIESEIELTDLLKSMGLKRIFSGEADFSGISNTPMQVSKVTQKAFLEVNEAGSEAAAATVVAIGFHIMDRDWVPFPVDHPFLVLIATEDIILFSGRVKDPKASTD